MTTSAPQRLSPLHELIAPLHPRWTTINDMPAPVSFDGDALAGPIQLGDASCLTRMGVKGAKAETWLVQQGIAVPPDVNSWTRTAAGTLVARLARSEFFLEDSPGGDTVAHLKAAIVPASGVSPVLRQDGALVLCGAQVNNLLTQICNVNFLTWPVDAHTVVMTSMVGVSVLVIWEPHLGLPRYRIWCDHTFAPYLWQTLVEIAQESGGGIVGLKTLMPEFGL